MLAVGACAWPVDAPLRLGPVVEVTVADPYAVVRALDAAVPAENRLGNEVGPVGGGRSVVRYAMLGTDVPRAAAAALADSVRVSPLAADVRTPLGVVAARQIGDSLTPRLSDAETQAALDRAFAGSHLAEGLEEVSFAAAQYERSLFYAQASSFSRFLAVTRGDRVFGRVVDRVLAGATAAEALASEGITNVVAEWQAWVRRTTS